MMAWLLFVPLVVLLTSDGTMALKDVECAYFDETFCFYTKLAYKQARWVAEDLKGHDKFREDEQRVSNLKLEILKILKIEEKYKLLPLLKNALGKSTNALFQLKVSCSGKRENPMCGTGLLGLFHVTYNLVVAAMQVTVGTELHTIEAALHKFENLLKDGKNMTLLDKVEHVFTLGTKVANNWNITSVDATS